MIMAGVAVRHRDYGYREQDGFIADAHHTCRCNSALKRFMFCTESQTKNNWWMHFLADYSGPAVSAGRPWTE